MSREIKAYFRKAVVFELFEKEFDRPPRGPFLT